MKKIIFLLSFIPSLSLAGIKSEYLTATASATVTGPILVSTDASGLSEGIIATKSSANGVHWWMEHTGAASTGNAMDWDWVFKGGLGIPELFGNLEVNSSGVGLGASEGKMDFSVKKAGGLTNVLSLRGSDLHAVVTVIDASTTTFNGVTYNWPNSQGGANTFPKNDGSGNISWATIATGVSLATTTPGATNYVFNQGVLNQGATYYVSSGSVSGQFTAGTYKGNIIPDGDATRYLGATDTRYNNMYVASNWYSKSPTSNWKNSTNTSGKFGITNEDDSETRIFGPNSGQAGIYIFDNASLITGSFGCDDFGPGNKGRCQMSPDGFTTNIPWLIDRDTMTIGSVGLHVGFRIVGTTNGIAKFNGDLFGTGKVSLSTDVVGSLQPANMVSTVAYTTDDSTFSMVMYITTNSANASWNSLTIPGPVFDFVNNSTITQVLAETMPSGSTVTFALESRNFKALNTTGTNLFNVTYSTANDNGVFISSFTTPPVLQAQGGLVFVTPAAGAAAGNPRYLRLTIFYKKRRT